MQSFLPHQTFESPAVHLTHSCSFERASLVLPSTLLTNL